MTKYYCVMERPILVCSKVIYLACSLDCFGIRTGFLVDLFLLPNLVDPNVRTKVHLLSDCQLISLLEINHHRSKCCLVSFHFWSNTGLVFYIGERVPATSSLELK
jgi:hypothetical protein